MVEETRGHAPASTNQMSLFDSREQDVLNALRAMQIDALSPIEALNRLNELKQKLE
jgi:hypothetical protein